MISAFLSLFGALFLVIAALGLVRMEDVYTRLHAASKAAPFGATFLLIGVAVAAGSMEASMRVIAICAFLLLTAPIAAHVIGRAAYLEGTRMDSSALDELAGKYDRETLTLHGVRPDEESGARDANEDKDRD